MLPTSADLREECLALDGFVSGLAPEDWRVETAFWGWSAWDEIVHLYMVDAYAYASIADAPAFETLANRHRADSAAGLELSVRLRRDFGHMDKDELLSLWRGKYQRLCDLIDAESPRRRVSWFGPDMTVATMAKARQMEVWAHGQDIYDAFGVRRTNADRIRNICDLGVRTFGWSFLNRNLTAPGPAPAVELIAPSGAHWRWNADQPGRISGSAEAFALVVTQRRNIADTDLVVEGEASVHWMQIAQCFAGPPADPPSPGERAAP